MVLISVFGYVGAITSAAEGKGLAAYYKFDGDFKDASGNGNDGTVVGDVSFTDSVNGKGAKFEGGYIEVAHNDSLNLESGYTISAWIYKQSTKDLLTQPIVVKTDGRNYDAYYFFNEQDRPGTAFYDNSPRNQVSKQFVEAQKWSLCTVTEDSQGIKFYVDGKLVESFSKQIIFKKSRGKLFIGYKETAFGNKFFKGVMDDLKIFNYALTPDEVKQEYSAIANGSGKYVISRPQGLVAFYRFEDNLDDLSGYGNNGTVIGADGGLTYTQGIAGKALNFDGASYIEVNDSDTLDMDKGITFSVWLKTDPVKKTGVTSQPIIDKQDGGTFLWNGSSEYKVYLGFDDRINFESHRDGGRFDAFNTPVTCVHALNKWYMLTITANGQDTKFYIDGVLKQTSTNANAVRHTIGKLVIGQSIIGFKSVFYKGMMDELRLYNYELSPKEVQALYGLKDTVKVTSANTILKKGAKEQLKATLQSYAFAAPTPEAGTGSNVIVLNKGADSFSKAVDITASASYSTSNKSVLTVNNGVVTATGKGAAAATAAYGTGPEGGKQFTVK